jgi:hypothetical protein
VRGGSGDWDAGRASQVAESAGGGGSGARPLASQLLSNGSLISTRV